LIRFILKAFTKVGKTSFINSACSDEEFWKKVMKKKSYIVNTQKNKCLYCEKVV